MDDPPITRELIGVMAHYFAGWGNRRKIVDSYAFKNSATHTEAKEGVKAGCPQAFQG